MFYLLCYLSTSLLGLESILFGLVNDQAAKVDLNVADTLQNLLFQKLTSTGQVDTPPIDLAATNINRGRDHGIPSYTKIRQLCGFPNISTFTDLSGQISPDYIQALANVYR